MMLTAKLKPACCIHHMLPFMLCSTSLIVPQDVELPLGVSCDGVYQGSVAGSAGGVAGFGGGSVGQL
jgi:hypothetical protein